MGLAPDELEPRRAAIAPIPWTWLNQVHGARVVVVGSPGEHAGAEADAAVTDVVGATLAVHTADCAGVLLRSEGPGPQVVGAAHAGWRGLEAGVLDATVSAMRELGAAAIRWQLGPCISAAHYEFSPSDLDRLVDRFGDRVRSRTLDDSAAFDLRVAVSSALSACGAEPLEPAGAPGDTVGPPCTAADGRYYSWRARGDRGRQAAVTWMTAPPGRRSR